MLPPNHKPDSYLGNGAANHGQLLLQSKSRRASMRSHQTQFLQHLFCVERNEVLETKTLSFCGSVTLTPPSTYPHQGQKFQRFSATESLGGTRNLKYKNKKWFYVIHSFEPKTPKLKESSLWGRENIHVVSSSPSDLDMLGGFLVCPQSHLRCQFRYISTVHLFRLFIWAVNNV